MKAHELDEMKNLNKTFNYDSGDVATMESTELTEEVFDDFDTVYEALRTGVEMELKNFTTNLLAMNVESFAWAFVTPTTEVFKDAWEHVVTKFTVRDVASREQFLERIRILFRNIFIEKMNIKDEQMALDLADAYYGVFKVSVNKLLDEMKPKEGEATPAAQDAETEQGNELTYR